MAKEYKKAAAGVGTAEVETAPVRSSAVRERVDIPKPAFWGVRTKKDYDLRE